MNIPSQSVEPPATAASTLRALIAEAVDLHHRIEMLDGVLADNHDPVNGPVLVRALTTSRRLEAEAQSLVNDLTEGLHAQTTTAWAAGAA